MLISCGDLPKFLPSTFCSNHQRPLQQLNPPIFLALAKAKLETLGFLQSRPLPRVCWDFIFVIFCGVCLPGAFGGDGGYDLVTTNSLFSLNMKIISKKIC